jgi:hypothetical protein
MFLLFPAFKNEGRFVENFRIYRFVRIESTRTQYQLCRNYLRAEEAVPIPSAIAEKVVSRLNKMMM